jgi:hypothetical protein
MLVIAALAAAPAGCGPAPEGGSDEVAASPPAPDPAPVVTSTTTTDAAPAAPAPEAPAPAPTSPPAGPVIEFATLVHDFGTIWDVDTQRCSFEFTNAGDERLVITEVRPSCGCTATRLAKREYEPGEGAAIEVSFDPKGFGRQRKTISVVSNSREHPALRLDLVADIRQFVGVAPAAIRFHEAVLGAESRATATVTSADPEMEIIAVRTTRSTAFVTARLLSGEGPPVAGATPPAGIIEVVLGPDAPWGQSYGTVEIDCRGRVDESSPTIVHTVSLPVSARVFGELSLDDTLFRVAVVLSGNEFEHTLRLSRTGGRPFTVVDLEVTRSTLGRIETEVIPIEGSNGSVYDLRISGDTGTYIGTLSGMVRVTTDVPGEEILDIPFAGKVHEVSK